MVGNIMLVIFPLLALSTNQISCIKKADQLFGAVAAQHTNEMSVHNIKHKLVPKIKFMDGSTSTSLILLLSSQVIVQNLNIHHALIAAFKPEVLHLVAIDKTHL
jgi:hypothetical protein